MSPIEKSHQASILIVDDDETILDYVNNALLEYGYDVTTATNGKQALERIAEAIPDLVVSDVMMPEMDGLSLLKALRSEKSTNSIPILLLTTKGSIKDKVEGLHLGADDYLTKPFDIEELIARVQSKIDRPPVPTEYLPQDRQTGLLSEQNFSSEAALEIIRSSHGGKAGCLAIIQIFEIPRLREQLGARAEREMAKQIADIIRKEANPLDRIGHDNSGLFMLLLPDTDYEQANQKLKNLLNHVADYPYLINREQLRITPAIGYAVFQTEKSFDEVRGKAMDSLEFAVSQLDLEPKAYNQDVKIFIEKKKVNQAPKSSQGQKLWEKILTPFQIILTIILSIIVPYFIYWYLDSIGRDITKVMYIFVVISLLTTAIMIWIEGFYALKKINPPDEPGSPYPKASAIIAAYLPNEAITIVETIEKFLQIEYPADLQIILAYNTPRDLPIIKVLERIAIREPRLMLLRVKDSESKSQNVNAALGEVQGEFVGIFDADHHPQKDAFTRAWRWLSNGYDVVQGHCMVRNGESSWVARMIAVEFEAIYAVSHPGRSRVYKFGIFGGSNGFWKTDLLRKTRMHGFMLTEDIDSSIRITESGSKIISDPMLISRELAPSTLKALWHQRLRWAQGWFQVSREHLIHTMKSSHLTLRQKIGVLYLLGWREIYPWLSVQMFPIIAFWVWKFGGLNKLDWLVPIFILTTLFTLSVGPGQAFFAYTVGAPEIKEHKSWFLLYLLLASLFYTEFKNIIARVAQIKEFMGERSWRITPRENS
jgi:cellulose synthase/poly-beta-1,6-N-acetylglucosamine synthase-like glycosyltransferase/CheY-like chemotaxis protein